MSDTPVEVVKPGHARHGRNGMVIAKRGDTYTVEFIDHDGILMRRHIENFEGRELRAVLRVRVRV